MDQMQKDVLDFHRAVAGDPDQTTPGIRRPELRASLIAEEAVETLRAITGQTVSIKFHDGPEKVEPDLVEAIDGMCDLIYVVLGTALEFGIDLQPFWAEVQRSNMAKAGGPVREDGKRLKPEGWTPPNIAGVLEVQSKLSDPSYVCSSTVASIPQRSEG